GRPMTTSIGEARIAGASDPAPAAVALLERNRSWRLYEWLFWATAAAAWFLLPSKALLLNEIAILGLFALSLDLLLGYAGIVSLGHGAFFGFGAYAAGLFARHAFAEPVTGLLFAGAATGVLGIASSFLVLR